jgi:hypothetical protein
MAEAMDRAPVTRLGISIRETAEVLGCSQGHVWNLIKRGRLLLRAGGVFRNNVDREAAIRKSRSEVIGAASKIQFPAGEKLEEPRRGETSWLTLRIFYLGDLPRVNCQHLVDEVVAKNSPAKRSNNPLGRMATKQQAAVEPAE